jgi:hypothetical protein
VILYHLDEHVPRAIADAFPSAMPSARNGEFTMSKKKIVKYTSDELKKLKDESDWDRAAGMTDEEIEAADALDPEVAGIDDAWMDKAKVVRSPKKTVNALPK